MKPSLSNPGAVPQRASLESGSRKRCELRDSLLSCTIPLQGLSLAATFNSDAAAIRALEANSRGTVVRLTKSAGGLVVRASRHAATERAAERLAPSLLLECERFVAEELPFAMGSAPRRPSRTAAAQQPASATGSDAAWPAWVEEGPIHSARDASGQSELRTLQLMTCSRPSWIWCDLDGSRWVLRTPVSRPFDVRPGTILAGLGPLLELGDPLLRPVRFAWLPPHDDAIVGKERLDWNLELVATCPLDAGRDEFVRLVEALAVGQGLIDTAEAALASRVQERYRLEYPEAC